MSRPPSPASLIGFEFETPQVDMKKFSSVFDMVSQVPLPHAQSLRRPVFVPKIQALSLLNGKRFAATGP